MIDFLVLKLQETGPQDWFPQAEVANFIFFFF